MRSQRPSGPQPVLLPGNWRAEWSVATSRGTYFVRNSCSVELSFRTTTPASMSRARPFSILRPAERYPSERGEKKEKKTNKKRKAHSEVARGGSESGFLLWSRHPFFFPSSCHRSSNPLPPPRSLINFVGNLACASVGWGWGLFASDSTEGIRV